MGTNGMEDVWVLDGVRTPIGRHRGALSSVRPDDLAAHVLRELLARQAAAKNDLEEVIFGATNQAGEDNRNVARMAVLLADLPYEVTGVTVNRLCASGLEAVVHASRAITVGDADVMVAGGVESMTRAPYAMPKAEEAFPRTPPPVYDTSLGWRFQNPKMAERFPLISMGETAENVAVEYRVSREDQDAFAVESHRKAARAWEAGRFANEIAHVRIPAAKKGGQDTLFDRDECIRADSTIEALAKLRPVFKKDGSVTAGNSSPLNDGASALLLASGRWVKTHGAKPMARVIASASAGVHPNVMGIGPIPAVRKVLARAGFASRSDRPRGAQRSLCGAIARVHTRARPRSCEGQRQRRRHRARHPIGSSGARIVVTLAHEMQKRGARYGLATLCVGVGQGLAVLLEGTGSTPSTT